MKQKRPFYQDRLGTNTYRKINTKPRVLTGGEHPDALATKNNIGTLQIRTGDYRAAVSTLQEALTIERRDLGESHDTTLHTCEQLALAHANLLEFETSIPLMRWE